MQNDVRALTLRVQKLEKTIALFRAPVRASVPVTKPLAKRPLPRLDISKTPVREFLERKHPGNAMEMTLLLAYYLRYYKGRMAFTLRDLETVFTRAKETPGNLRQHVDACVKDGLLEQGKSGKTATQSWRVTVRGWTLILHDFQVRR